jgi:LytS/YehU family sensor histidine kinase
MFHWIKKNFRFFAHTGFWLFWICLYWFQNQPINYQHFFFWITILLVLAMVIYINLYVLFPYFLFKKKYFDYSLLIIADILLGAILITYMLPEKSVLRLPFIQNILNVTFFVIISSSLKFLREFLRKQELLVKSENEQLKTELSLLKSQVNPHFLFNTLNNLYGLIVQNQNKQAADITLKLSDLMRYLLESSKTEQVSLQKEVKFLEDYLALEKVRLAQKADICLEVSGVEKDVFVAPLLFIPLVENAFKHGLQGISENSFAHFSIALQDNELYFEAKNSVGKNFDAQTQSGTGLENLRKRLMLIYPDKHLLDIENTGGVFKITLQLSL